MSRDSRLNVPRGVAVFVALALLLTGALASYLFVRARAGSANHEPAASNAEPASRSAVPHSGGTPGAESLPDVVVPANPGIFADVIP